MYQSLEGKVALFVSALFHNVKCGIQGVLWELQRRAGEHTSNMSSPGRGQVEHAQHIIELILKLCYDVKYKMVLFLGHIHPP